MHFKVESLPSFLPAPPPATFPPTLALPFQPALSPLCFLPSLLHSFLSLDFLPSLI